MELYTPTMQKSLHTEKSESMELGDLTSDMERLDHVESIMKDQTSIGQQTTVVSE